MVDSSTSSVTFWPGDSLLSLQSPRLRLCEVRVLHLLQGPREAGAGKAGSVCSADGRGRAVGKPCRALSASSSHSGSSHSTGKIPDALFLTLEVKSQQTERAWDHPVQQNPPLQPGLRWVTFAPGLSHTLGQSALCQQLFNCSEVPVITRASGGPVGTSILGRRSSTGPGATE